MTNEKIKANQKLWKVTKDIDGYYYEIRAKGMVIDRIKINEPALTYLVKNKAI